MRTCICLLALFLCFAAGPKAQTIIFQDGFESGTFNPAYWTPHPSIAGAPGGRVDVINSPDNAHTGTFYAALSRSTDGPSTTNALDLRLDLSGQSQVELRFWLRDYYDETQAQEGLYFSDDGGATFTQVLPFELDEETENVYLDYPPIDVDALAAAHGLALTSTFVIRFQQIGTGDLSGCCSDRDGFLIDDVSVTVPAIEYAALPFTDGFEGGALGPMWHEANASEPAVGQPTAPAFAPTRRGGLVQVRDVSGSAHTGTFYAALSRSTDGPSTTNALDLRLDLSGQSQVELRFWLRDHYDETQAQEGLYFSDDGGATFTQVVQLDPSSLPDAQYSEIITDVDALAAAHGLALTSTFVIRFQQIGTGDLSGCCSDRDGFLIDDVSVIGDVNTPIEEGPEASVPTALTFTSSYPNPFRSATTIRYGLPSASHVRVTVYDALGRHVATLVDQEQVAGWHTAAFDGSDLPNGLYLCRAEAGASAVVQQVTVLK